MREVTRADRAGGQPGGPGRSRLFFRSLKKISGVRGERSERLVELLTAPARLTESVHAAGATACAGTVSGGGSCDDCPNRRRAGGQPECGAARRRCRAVPRPGGAARPGQGPTRAVAPLPPGPASARRSRDQLVRAPGAGSRHLRAGRGRRLPGREDGTETWDGGGLGAGPRRGVSADFRTGTSAPGSGEFEVELASAHQGTVVSAGRSAWRRTGESARRLILTVMLSPLVMISPGVSGKRRWRVSGVAPW
jgi:hypothetical protein